MTPLSWQRLGRHLVRLIPGQIILCLTLMALTHPAGCSAGPGAKAIDIDSRTPAAALVSAVGWSGGVNDRARRGADLERERVAGGSGDPSAQAARLGADDPRGVVREHLPGGSGLHHGDRERTRGPPTRNRPA